MPPTDWDANFIFALGEDPRGPAKIESAGGYPPLQNWSNVKAEWECCDVEGL